MRLFKSKRGVSTIEYAAMAIIVMLVSMGMYQYAYRAMAGKWKQVGDTFGYGRQYDPEDTIECAYSPFQNVWYEVDCYDDCVAQYQTVHPECDTMECLDGACADGSCAIEACESIPLQNVGI